MTFTASSTNFLYAIPFVGMLLSLALGPLLASEFWHRHYAKISLGWTSLVIGMLIVGFGVSQSLHHVMHMLFHEYIPFIAVIGALFTITGGIHIVIRARSTPFVNTLFLLYGSLIASMIGTTGAAMLLIRPFIDMNKNRFYRTHLVIFFIFTVANIGGCLTPLGDPPLFLGYLQGVPFSWPFLNLLKPFVLTIIPLLALFWGIDAYLMVRDRRRPGHQAPLPRQRGEPWFHMTGQLNVFLLGGLVLLIWLSGLWTDSPKFLGIDLSLAEILRIFGLMALGYLSWQFTSGTVRHYNHFTWEPFREVCEVFMGIFTTLIPVSAMLHQGNEGPFRALISLTNPDGVPNSLLYFWVSGMLSGVLDNAPTYLVFFNMLGGVAKDSLSVILAEFNTPLIAISLGSVFMGALTYIGNAPNFMIRSIAVKRHVAMPSFFGYMIWSLGILIPLFFLLGWVVF